MTTKPTRWLASRLGRRGAALAVLGLIFLFVGLDVLLAPDAPDYDRFLIHTFLPHPVRALLWLIPGGVALWASLRKGPTEDAVGFNFLVIPLIVRIVSYVFSSVAYLLGIGTWAVGWTSALIWLAILALVLIIAGWAEVPDNLHRKHRRRWR
ncbi:membrane protein [Arthrobacter phage TforTroy]|uniref:Membrane protein n=1 Tax=Arthrobacter phage TforTroy TaxID=3118973 RepID=A0ABZ2CU53_9CAUD